MFSIRFKYKNICDSNKTYNIYYFVIIQYSIFYTLYLNFGLKDICQEENMYQLGAVYSFRMEILQLLTVQISR